MTGHSGEFWQNMVQWRREWQTTPVFLPWEPHKQYEKAKRYDTERWTPQVGRCPICYWRRDFKNSPHLNLLKKKKKKKRPSRPAASCWIRPLSKKSGGVHSSPFKSLWNLRQAPSPSWTSLFLSVNECFQNFRHSGFFFFFAKFLYNLC